MSDDLFYAKEGRVYCRPRSRTMGFMVCEIDEFMIDRDKAAEEIAEALNLKESQAKAPETTVLPDGSAFFTGSLPLPKDHWLYAEGAEAPPAPLRLGVDSPLRQPLADALKAAVQYGVRASTMNGTDANFDPDAVVQNVIVGLLGYWTSDGTLGGDLKKTENTL